MSRDLLDQIYDPDWESEDDLRRKDQYLARAKAESTSIGNQVYSKCKSVFHSNYYQACRGADNLVVESNSVYSPAASSAVTVGNRLRSFRTCTHMCAFMRTIQHVHGWRVIRVSMRCKQMHLTCMVVIAHASTKELNY